MLLDNAGHLTAAPELVVEVLSLGQEQERRDQEAKKLYSARGVQEYWIVNWRLQQIEYRRDQAALKLTATLLADDELTSSLLPALATSVAGLFV